MAGIGFALRKLSDNDDFIGVARAYVYATIAAIGPWILIAVIFAYISISSSELFGRAEINSFYAVMIYNILLSFLLASPIYMISARYTADCLYRRDPSPILGIFVTSSYFLMIPALVIAIILYLFYATMSPLATLLSIVNLVLLSQIWLDSLFLTSIRSFRTLTLAWVIGALVAMVISKYIPTAERIVGMLVAVDAGFLFILFVIRASITAEYRYRFIIPKDFPFYFRHYKGLFLTGFMLFAGMWVDKVIMWFDPSAIVHLNNLRTNPTYDGAMFLAFLTIIPVMGLFFYTLETNFFDNYVQYIMDIETNVPLKFIEEQNRAIGIKLLQDGRLFLVIQGSITIAAICAGPYIYNLFTYDYMQLGIFRLGTLGAFFNALNLFIVVIFSYFDSQENMVKVSGFMLLSNFCLTLLFRTFGFPFFGYGYCLSMILTFCLGALLLTRFLDHMTYYVWIFNVVKRHKLESTEVEPSLAKLSEMKPSGF